MRKSFQLLPTSLYFNEKPPHSQLWLLVDPFMINKCEILSTSLPSCYFKTHTERIILTIRLNLLPTFPWHMWYIFHSQHILFVLSRNSIPWSNYPWFHSMHIYLPSHNSGYRVCTRTELVVHWKMETSCVYNQKKHSLKQNTSLYSWLWSVL